MVGGGGLGGVRAVGGCGGGGVLPLLVVFSLVVALG